VSNVLGALGSIRLWKLRAGAALLCVFLSTSKVLESRGEGMDNPAPLLPYEHFPLRCSPRDGVLFASPCFWPANYPKVFKDNFQPGKQRTSL